MGRGSTNRTSISLPLLWDMRKHVLITESNFKKYKEDQSDKYASTVGMVTTLKN